MKSTHKDQWIAPIEEFSATRQNLPHLQDPGGWYWLESNTWSGLELSEQQRDLVMDAILFHNNKKYTLRAAVVMPTHLHLILQPSLKTSTGYYSLAEIFHSIKSYTAKQIAKELREKETVFDHLKPLHIWQDENYDHLIRNEKDYFEKLHYLIMNPVEAGLVSRPEDYKWLYWKKE